MKKLILITLLFCCAFTIKAQNLILNGSFEQNSVTGVDCEIDISNSVYNSLIQHSTAFSVYGLSENHILFENCIYSGAPLINVSQHGLYSIILLSTDTVINSFQYLKHTAISLKLVQPLQIGSYYKLNYYHKKIPDISFNNYINGKEVIGISNYDTTFGINIYTSSTCTSEWTEVEVIFKAIISAEYLTVKSHQVLGLRASLIDSFVLTLDSMPPNAINEQYGKKKLLKIVDILGRESKSKKGLLFYIYSDGTVEKKLIIE